jgi:hypothetical protein
MRAGKLAPNACQLPSLAEGEYISALTPHFWPSIALDGAVSSE